MEEEELRSQHLVSDFQMEKGLESKKEKITSRKAVLTPGTFPLDSSRDPDPYRRAKGKKRKGWKEEARKVRRGKRR